jgi:CBS domain containing-hemolysin-like protein
MERINRQVVADKLGAYLHHELSLADLVDWAESAMMQGEFDLPDVDVLRTVVARLGVADVRAFGLTWEDCEQLLRQLGYSAQVSIVAS